MTSPSRRLIGKWRTWRTHVQRHGIVAGARLLVGLPLERSGVLRVGVCYALPEASVALEGVSTPSGLEVRLLSAEETRERAARREDWFFPGAVEASLRRGDLCFGGFLGDVLVTSTWYATEPLFVLGGTLVYGSDCVWAQRMYTKPEHRGRGYSSALEKASSSYFAERGRNTFLNVVEWTNDSSRRLQRKNGYQPTATLICVGPIHRGRAFLFGGSAHGIRLLDRAD